MDQDRDQEQHQQEKRQEELEEARGAKVARQGEPMPPRRCPRCGSDNTKFCYFNNYSLLQPRYFCKTCRRYWTHGGSIRDVPLGGKKRRFKKGGDGGASSSAPAGAGNPYGFAQQIPIEGVGFVGAGLMMGHGQAIRGYVTAPGGVVGGLGSGFRAAGPALPQPFNAPVLFGGYLTSPGPQMGAGLVAQRRAALAAPPLPTVNPGLAAAAASGGEIEVFWSDNLVNGGCSGDWGADLPGGSVRPPTPPPFL